MRKNQRNKKNIILLGIILSPLLIIQSVFEFCYLIKHYEILVFLAILSVVLVLFSEGILLYKSRKKLTYEQLVEMSSYYTNRFLDKKYVFSKKSFYIDKSFKTNLETKGCWYPCNILVSHFPSYISCLLKEKHFEWVVLGIESQGYVKSFWINRGGDSSQVAFKCSLGEIASKCEENNCYTVLRLHNHPNPNPRLYNTLLASSKDYESAQSCSEYFSAKGINWMDFVCSQGQFVCFFKNISPSFQIPGNSVSEYVDEMGLSLITEYLLHRKYARTKRIYRVSKRVFFFGLIPFIHFSLYASFVSDVSKMEAPKENPKTDVIETVLESTTETTKLSIPEIVCIPVKKVSSDSEYVSKSGKDYSANQLIDNDYSTCWQEGSDGNGIGETLSFEFDETTIYRIDIVNGNRSYDGSYSKNNRLSDITLAFYSEGNMVFEESMTLTNDQNIEIEEFNLETPIKCDLMIITIDGVYEGTGYSDTGVSEITIYGEG